MGIAELFGKTESGFEVVHKIEVPARTFNLIILITIFWGIIAVVNMYQKRKAMACK